MLKRTGILATLLFFCVWLAQSQNEEPTYTFHFKGSSLKNVLSEITKQSDKQFSYNPKYIPVDTLISYKCEHCKLNRVLSEISDLCQLQFEYVENHVVLKPKENEPEKLSAEERIKYFTFSGYITDAKNQEVLIGAAVFDTETNIGVITNNYGFFSLTLPEGIYNITTSYLGYNLSSKRIELNDNIIWNIGLMPLSSMVEEIVVISTSEEKKLVEFLAGQTEMKPKEAKSQTAALGETDMLKAFDNLPGVSFQNDGSSYFYVRGGNRDQNLILLDEAPIYNPSHMFGLFTPIIPDAIQATNIYKADFPIQYGGRLSSIIDVRTRDGDKEKFGGSATLGLVSTRLGIEGPLKKGQGSYFVSYRRSHFGMFVKKIQPAINDFFFNDFTTKLNFTIGQRDRLFLTFYNGKDKFITEDNTNVANGLQWGNTSLTLRWNHLFSDRLFSNTTFYTSNYDYFLYTDYENDRRWNSHISSTHLKTDFSWFIRPENKVNYGVKMSTYFFNPGNHNAPELTLSEKVSTNNSFEIVTYIGHELKLNERAGVKYGLRITNWSNSGESFVVKYNTNYEYINHESYKEGENYYNNASFEPRLSLMYELAHKATLKASFNRTLQHINLINNSISPFNSLEVWLPSGPNIKPQKANVFNIGLNKLWLEKNVEFNFDCYYKKLFNQIGYAYHAKTLLNPLIEGELRQGNGKAYGFELLLKKTQGRLSGQISYGYTRSLLKINGLNGNREFKARQDKPIDFSLALGYRVKPRWIATINLTYGSGMRVTTPTSFYYYRGSQVPVYAAQNNSKLPDYKRIDISNDFMLNKVESNFEHHLTVSVFNFFGAVNPAFIQFSKTKNTNGDFVIPADKLNVQEQVPTHRFIYSFMPSITYNLKF